MPQYMLLDVRRPGPAPAQGSPEGQAEFGRLDGLQRGHGATPACASPATRCTAPRPRRPCACRRRARRHRRAVRRDEGDSSAATTSLDVPDLDAALDVGRAGAERRARQRRGAPGRGLRRVSADGDAAAASAVAPSLPRGGPGRPRDARAAGSAATSASPRTRCRTRSPIALARLAARRHPPRPGARGSRRPRAQRRSTACAASAALAERDGRRWSTACAWSRTTPSPRTDERDRRRPPAPRLHVLPPGARDGRAGRADAADRSAG